MNPAKWVSSEAADYPKGISISLYPNIHFLQLPKERRRSLGMCFLPTKCPLPDKVKSWMQNFLWIWDNDSKTENRKKNWNYPIKGDTNDNFLSLPCFWVYRKKKKEKKTTPHFIICNYELAFTWIWGMNSCCGNILKTSKVNNK